MVPGVNSTSDNVFPVSGSWNVINTGIANTPSINFQTPSRNLIYNNTTSTNNIVSDNISSNGEYKVPVIYTNRPKCTDRSTFNNGMEVRSATDGNVTETPINSVTSFNIHPETSMAVQGTLNDNSKV